MSEQFQPGDIVVLKSGSPKMTIESLPEVGRVIKVRCSWFDGSKKTTDIFAPEALQKVESAVQPASFQTRVDQ